MGRGSPHINIYMRYNQVLALPCSPGGEGLKFVWGNAKSGNKCTVPAIVPVAGTVIY